MPNRIIKSSICTSDTLEMLKPLEEVAFYRLMVNCDDYGRFDARPKILKAALFPLKDITVKQMSDALDALRTAGIVDLYQVDGKPYLQLRTWAKHQQIRSAKSKYPAPDSENAISIGNSSKCNQLISSDINCNQMISDDIKCPRNPIQSNPNPNPNPNPIQTSPLGIDADFELFWMTYPNKKGKEAAKKAWKKIKPTKELVGRIMSAIESQKCSTQWLKNNGQFIPHPATWLNQGRWDDEIGPSKNQTFAFDGSVDFSKSVGGLRRLREELKEG